MLKNYLIIALRSIRKQRVYACINIFGLATGLACSILILLFVNYEYSYDRFYEHSDRIFRILAQYPEVNIGVDYLTATPTPLAPTLEEEFPEVAFATRIQRHPNNGVWLSHGDEHFWETGVRADDHFFDVFPTSFLEGDPQSALDAPY